MVTIEIAFAALGAVAGLVVLAWMLAVVMLFGLCQDLAAGLARQQARGDQAAVAKIMAQRPDGAQVATTQSGAEITVAVDLDARPWAAWLPSLPVHADATVVREPA